MKTSPYHFLDTPSLLIDKDIMTDNLDFMQKKANRFKVSLRPHTKTHKMSDLAKLQIEFGAAGITVAKTGEAEVMAAQGLQNVFIANQIVGHSKLKRIKTLNRSIDISLGVDDRVQIDQLEAVFSGEKKKISVLIEIEVGENRAGIIGDEKLLDLAKYIHSRKNVTLEGVFSHEGHTYKAKDINACIEAAAEAHARTIRAADLIRGIGIDLKTVSIGATPSLMQCDIPEGITEIRPGTYILMDAGQGAAIGSFDRCAATILATVTSKPTEERVIVDAGAKALTSQNRGLGICHTPGFGLLKGFGGLRLDSLYDEHGVIMDRTFRSTVSIGDKVEIIPNHICPTCNLFDVAYLVSRGEVIQELPVLCRGKLQ